MAEAQIPRLTSDQFHGTWRSRGREVRSGQVQAKTQLRSRVRIDRLVASEFAGGERGLGMECDFWVCRSAETAGFWLGEQDGSIPTQSGSIN